MYSKNSDTKRKNKQYEPSKDRAWLDVVRELKALLKTDPSLTFDDLAKRLRIGVDAVPRAMNDAFLSKKTLK